MSSDPRVTVFTVTHHPRFLDECFDSLASQTYGDWEWVVLLNSGARWRPARDDSRLRIVIDDSISGVGPAKQRACAEARGSLLVELDHDDLLAYDALAEIARAFEQKPGVSLVYSHSAQILEDGSRDDSRFDVSNGWVYHDTTVAGREVSTPSPSPPRRTTCHTSGSPRTMCERTTGSRTAGRRLRPHATRSRRPGPDVQALPGRDFHLIDECLYLQRMHSRNTQRDAQTNAFIQQETVALYDRYIESNALAWAARDGLLALDLGAAHNRPRGYLGVDQYPGDDVDIVATLPDRLPVDDNSVGVIRAVDFLEHVADKVGLINELYRVLAPGGLLLSQTPSTDGRGAFQDPTHVAFYNENSFWYYTERQYRNFVPQIKAAFQVSRLVTYFPTEWHEQHRIPYVTANLIALKESTPRNGGRLLI